MLCDTYEDFEYESGWEYPNSDHWDDDYELSPENCPFGGMYSPGTETCDFCPIGPCMTDEEYAAMENELYRDMYYEPPISRLCSWVCRHVPGIALRWTGPDWYISKWHDEPTQRETWRHGSMGLWRLRVYW